MKKLQFSINIPVWGDSYLENFIKYCLPAHLAEGNLPEIQERVLSYNIYTKKEHLQKLQKNNHLSLLKQTVPHKIICIDSLISAKTDKYNLNSCIYRNALNLAFSKASGCILLNSDHLISKNTFIWIIKLIDSGYRLIEIPGPRTDLSKVSKYLLKNIKQGRLSIESNNLLSLWYNNMHEDLKFHFVNGKEIGINPSHLYWNIKKYGVIARCCHLFPVAIVPDKKIENNFTTVDDDLLKNYNIGEKQTLIEKSVDKFFICELSKPGTVMGPSAEKTNLNSFFKFFDKNIDRNLSKYKTEIVLSNKKNEEVSKKSFKFIKKILEKYKKWKFFSNKDLTKTYNLNFIYKDKYDIPNGDTPFFKYVSKKIKGDKIIFVDKPFLNKNKFLNFRVLKVPKKIHRDVFKTLLKVTSAISKLGLPCRFINEINPNYVKINCAEKFFCDYKKNKMVTLVCQNSHLSLIILSKVISDKKSLFMASKINRPIKQNKKIAQGLYKIFGKRATKIFYKKELELDLIGISEKNFNYIKTKIKKIPASNTAQITDKGLLEDTILHALYYNLI